MKTSLRGPVWAMLALLGMLHGEARALMQQPGGKLNIVIVEGEGAINNIRQRIAREPIVQVEDENHKPVAGAVVTFTSPRQGASALFPGNSTSLRVTTDAQGRATARGLKANSKVGAYQIAVVAVAGGLTAQGVIHWSNQKAGGASWLKYAILGGIAAGAIIAIIVARGGDPASTVLIPGAPTVGGR